MTNNIGTQPWLHYINIVFEDKVMYWFLGTCNTCNVNRYWLVKLKWNRLEHVKWYPVYETSKCLQYVDLWPPQSEILVILGLTSIWPFDWLTPSLLFINTLQGGGKLEWQLPIMRAGSLWYPLYWCGGFEPDSLQNSVGSHVFALLDKGGYSILKSYYDCNNSIWPLKGVFKNTHTQFICMLSCNMASLDKLAILFV